METIKIKNRYILITSLIVLMIYILFFAQKCAENIAMDIVFWEKCCTSKFIYKIMENIYYSQDKLASIIVGVLWLLMSISLLIGFSFIMYKLSDSEKEKDIINNK